MAAISFRAFTREDYPRLASWLREPHVARWWPMEDTSIAALDAYYGPAVDGADPSRLYLVLDDARPVGFAQAYLHADHPDWDRAVALPGVAGIDYLLGRPELCGHGLGTAVIAAFVEHVYALYPDVAGIVAAPQAANPASRRVLEKNGFELVEVREIESDDPSDAGPAAIYLLRRAPRAL